LAGTHCENAFFVSITALDDGWAAGGSRERLLNAAKKNIKAISSETNREKRERKAKVCSSVWCVISTKVNLTGNSTGI
jgi:hypothetical protein